MTSVTATATTRLIDQFRAVRSATDRLCEPLSSEDCNLQSMPDVSPAKWHLAHTTWFFETFLLSAAPGYRPFDPRFNFVFNSYYEAVGPRHPRPQRGLLSRPTLDEVYCYRAKVDDAIAAVFEGDDGEAADKYGAVLTLGLHHEQQHQELILTDILHAFSLNPLRPAYRSEATTASGDPVPMRWLDYPAGLPWVGHDGQGFAFDNEGPRHRVYVNAYRLASRLVTCGEYLEFVADGGYTRPELWLSDGWAVCRARAWDAPLYWESDGDHFQQFSLFGLRPVDPAAPVSQVSFYEADAFARWAGARLPTEAEWESAAVDAPPPGDPEDPSLAPRPLATPTEGLAQLDRDVWQWTASPYVAYPGYKPAAGALGEYNGKFMCNQMVLRGGSCATPRSHLRRTYRNFFPPDARWQFTGIRLASDR